MSRARKTTGVIALCGVVVAVALIGSVTSAGAARESRMLLARMSGGNEVPGPGDPEGHGIARVTITGDRICFHLTWNGIEAPVAAHIHVGGSDVAGDVVVPLFVGAIPAPIDEVGGCVTADEELAQEIAAHPRHYYVNVHTEQFTAGAIRGKLFHPRES